MKQVVIATALIAFAFAVPAYAQQSAETVSPLDVCENTSAIGSVIMAKRQGNAPMGDLMRVAARSELPSMMIGMVRMAYEQPRYSTDRMQQVAVRDFENDVYAACIALFTQ